MFMPRRRRTDTMLHPEIQLHDARGPSARQLVLPVFDAGRHLPSDEVHHRRRGAASNPPPNHGTPAATSLSHLRPGASAPEDGDQPMPSSRGVKGRASPEDGAGDEGSVRPTTQAGGALETVVGDRSELLPIRTQRLVSHPPANLPYRESTYNSWKWGSPDRFTFWRGEA